MISRILRQAQDEEIHRHSGLILSLSKDADALTQVPDKGKIRRYWRSPAHYSNKYPNFSRAFRSISGLGFVTSGNSSRQW